MAWYDRFSWLQLCHQFALLFNVLTEKLTCILSAVIIIISYYATFAVNVTFVTTTTTTSTTGFYTPAPTTPTTIPSSAPTLKYPTTSSPTWMPTVNGEFPYIHYVQSDIECSKNIALLQDEMDVNVYAEFTITRNISNVQISFIVCKAYTTFHFLDKLYLWYGDDDNSTQWNVTQISQIHPSGACTIFEPLSNITFYPQTYFLGLVRYNGEDYGKYTVYMQCDTNYNQYITDGIYNEYLQPDLDQSHQSIGSISCGITLIHSVTTDEWFHAINRQQFYSFTVLKYAEWVRFSTCDLVEKQHSITIYYYHAANDYATIKSAEITIESCSSLQKYYLIPGTYYVSIDVTHLLYNDYTLNMQCSADGSVLNVTDYAQYIPPTPHPTKPPMVMVSIWSTSHRDITQKDEWSDSVSEWYIVIVIGIIGLCFAFFFAYLKYKKRNVSDSNNLDEKIASMEMAPAASVGSFDNDMDDNKAAANEGGGVGEGGHLMDGEGNDSDQRPADEVAPAAFSNTNFDTPAMVAISVAAPMANYDENINEIAVAAADVHDLELEVNEDGDNSLPDEQWEMQIGSYCYIDDNDNVFGVVVDELQYEYFLIVDFFEKRKRKTHKKSLALIQNVKDLQKAKKQYLRYKRKKSSNTST